MTSRIRRSFLTPASPAGAAAALLLIGCAGSSGNHKAPTIPPSTVQPSRVGVFATAPTDSNANGYLDTMDIIVYVSSDQYAIPLAVPGSFEFRLLGKNKTELAKWTFDEAQTTRALRGLAPGPGYQFHLNVLDLGPDEYEAQSTELSAVFRPRIGTPVTAPLTPFRFGKMQ